MTGELSSKQLLQRLTSTRDKTSFLFLHQAGDTNIAGGGHKIWALFSPKVSSHQLDLGLGSADVLDDIICD